MPEPEPYYDPNTPVQSNPYSYDAYAGYVATSTERQRQPVVTPTSQPHAAGSHQLPPPQATQYETSPVNRRNKALPDPYGSSSQRPPGASAPAIPSLYGSKEQDWEYDAYEPNGYYSQSSQPAKHTPPSAATAISRQESRDTLNSSKYQGKGAQPSPNDTLPTPVCESCTLSPRRSVLTSDVKRINQHIRQFWRIRMTALIRSQRNQTGNLGRARSQTAHNMRLDRKSPHQYTAGPRMPCATWQNSKETSLRNSSSKMMNSGTRKKKTPANSSTSRCFLILPCNSAIECLGRPRLKEAFRTRRLSRARTLW